LAWQLIVIFHHIADGCRTEITHLIDCFESIVEGRLQLADFDERIAGKFAHCLHMLPQLYRHIDVKTLAVPYVCIGMKLCQAVPNLE
jgi:hypothetical protein